MMHRLNVRCCCQPEKILGTLELQSLNREQRFPIMTKLPLPSGEIEFTAIQYLTIQLKQYGDELAVYSDDRPIEFWRQFRGFNERILAMADNTNPSAQSDESTGVFGDITQYSINEPLVDEPQAFKIPEEENDTTVDNLLLAYPDGYVAEFVFP